MATLAHDPHRDDVVISVNPKAGAGAAAGKVQRFKDLLLEAGCRAHVHADLNQAAEISHRFFERGSLRALVGAGGDGTMAELANRTLPGLPLATYPSGTENLLAKHLGVQATPESAAAVVIGGKRKQFDCGSANGRLFLLMASCGFDAEVIERLHAVRSGNITHATYVKPILAAMRSYQWPELRVRCGGDGTEAAGDQTSLRWVFVFNLPCYAFGLGISPGSKGDDGRLDVCGFRRGSTLLGLKYLASVLRGSHERLPDCQTQTATRLRIESDGPVPYQLDGDPGGHLPLEINIVPGRLTLLAP